MDASKLMSSVMGMVQDGKEDEAKEMVNHVVNEVKNNSFGLDDIIGLAPKAMGIIKPESLGEVKDLIGKFVSANKK